MLGPIVSCCDGGRFGSFLASLAHGWSIVTAIFGYAAIGLFSSRSLGRTMLGVFAVVQLQRAVFRILTIFFLTREMEHARANSAWWSGRWCASDLGWRAAIMPGRELLCKVIEMSAFAADFVAAHVILCMLWPICFIPFIDRVHMYMLLWTLPKRTEDSAFKSKSGLGGGRPTGRVMTAAHRRTRRRRACSYGLLLGVVFAVTVSVVAAPMIVPLDAVAKKVLKSVPF
ncbi:hypothetical protein DFJ73DRAFT_162096 [Zopfochytrium polystomum]|nr:hypothetical protein DFJ73DRAFT_162096 [Zopfochytrium polystomum]